MGDIRNKVIYLFVFLVPFSIYLLSTLSDYRTDLNDATYRRVLPSYDVVSNTYLPYLLLKHGTFDFRAIYNSIKQFDDATKKTPYFLIRRDQSFYSSYPIITGLFALPVYAPVILLKKIPELTYAENILKVALMGRLTASIMASLSVLLFYNLIRKRSNSELKTLLFTAFYAFGTGTFSVSSRGLWLHTLTQLLFTLVLIILTKKDKKNADFTLLGLLLGLNVLNRVTNIVFALTISVYVLYAFRQKLKFFVLGAVPCVIYFFSYNYMFFGSPFVEGYAAREAANVWTANLFESIPGMFISPARGLLFASPLLLLGFAAIPGFIRRKEVLNIFISAGVILSILMMAKWYCWHGANAFGNRMLVDYLPFMGYLSFLYFSKLSRVQLTIATALTIMSIYFHSNAVFLRNSRCSEENNWNFKCLQWGGR